MESAPIDRTSQAIPALDHVHRMLLATNIVVIDATTDPGNNILGTMLQAMVMVRIHTMTESQENREITETIRTMAAVENRASRASRGMRNVPKSIANKSTQHIMSSVRSKSDRSE